jgi:hypothetical protein
MIDHEIPGDPGFSSTAGGTGRCHAEGSWSSTQAKEPLGFAWLGSSWIKTSGQRTPQRTHLVIILNGYIMIYIYIESMDINGY